LRGGGTVVKACRRGGRAANPEPEGRLSAAVSNLTVQSDRTTSYSFLQIELPEAEGYGPYLSSIRVLTVGRNRTANHLWKVVAQWSLDGTTFSNVDLSGVVSANGQLIHPAVNTGDVLTAPILRFAVGVANSTGTALEQATCSGWGVFTFQT
jgi:hypothetical protein